MVALLQPRTYATTKPPPSVTVDGTNPLTAGLRAAWLFNDGGGLVARDLAGFQSAAGTGTPTWDIGPGGPVTTLNGTSQYWALGNVYDATTNMTVMARVKRTGATGPNTIISKEGNTGTSGWVLQVNGGGGLEFYAPNATAGDDVNGATGITDTTHWYTLACTHSASFLTIYVDGVQDGQVAATGTPNASSLNLAIGFSNVAVGRYWPGSIDYVYLWQRVLSPAEMLAVRAAPYKLFQARPFRRLAPNWIPAGKQLVVPASRQLAPRSADNWTLSASLSPPAASISSNLDTYGIGTYGNAQYGARLVINTPAPGQQITTPGLGPRPGENFSLVASHFPGYVPVVQPTGQQIIAPAAVSPHQGDNWSLIAPRIPLVTLAGLPPGIVQIDPPAVSPHARDNWTLTYSHNPAYLAPAPQPPGAQIVTPAAVPPHQGDNWGLIAPRVPLVILNPQPPGQTQIDPPARPPHQSDNWTASVSQNPAYVAPSPQPAGQQLVIQVPAVLPPPGFATSLNLSRVTQMPMGGATAEAGNKGTVLNWSFSASHFGGYLPPLPQPPGVQIVTPNAVPPHQRDDWSIYLQNGPPPAPIPAAMPQGAQITTYTLAWAQAPNYTWVRTLTSQDLPEFPFPESPLAPVTDPTASALTAAGATSVSALGAGSTTVVSPLTDFDAD